DMIYAGADDARVLSIDSKGRLEPLREFDAVAGRDEWYAGSALVDGRVVGPPLGVRSMAATCDGAVLLVNIHVGGIPRSSDRGKSWQPTIDIDVDVHQVCTHPTRPEWAIAAAGAGLCVSHDAGASWTIEREGLHAPYCSAVAFAGDDILVAASADHFAPEGTIYRRSFGESGPLQPLGGGPARWITGICDTACIDVNGSVVALADRAGNVHLSEDLGRSWSCCATGHPSPSAVVIL
ncbi:MAG: WD40/YVTN/BNR-like repeat-containing protein, partial [Steroidobacteraceae bacterium]